MTHFTVSSEELFDPKKNPGLKLGAKEILENKHIEKKYPDRSFQCSCCKGKYSIVFLADKEEDVCKFCVKK